MCYLYYALKFPQTCVDVICHELKNPVFDRPTHVVGTGVSGVLLLSPVSVQSGIPSLVVRKPVDKCPVSKGGSHSRKTIEGLCWKTSNIRYVIIDDTIDSGATVDRVMEAMDEIDGVCVGIVLYNHYGTGKDTDLFQVPVSHLRDDIEVILRSQQDYHD